jgi:hypothetical protein
LYLLEVLFLGFLTAFLVLLVVRESGSEVGFRRDIVSGESGLQGPKAGLLGPEAGLQDPEAGLQFLDPQQGGAHLFLQQCDCILL